MDDSCKNVIRLWLAEVFTGIESKLEPGDKLLFYLKDERAYHQKYRIISGTKKRKKLDNLILKYFKHFKYFETITHKFNNVSAIGINRENNLPMAYVSSEQCFYEIHLENNKINTYKHDKIIEIDEWEPFSFKVENQKLKIKSKNIESILKLH